MSEQKGSQQKPLDVRQEVRSRYGQLAENFSPDAGCGCGCDCSTSGNVSQLYAVEDVLELPQDVTGLSLGCGDPITLAALQPGQVVLDLGSGGGIDCFLAARRVGESGYAIGVDMTPAMLDRARQNQAKLGFTNVDFRLGEIEHLPVENESVDVIISNCVINLSPDKAQVFREAFRALKPGGKLAVSDILTDGPFPEAFRANMEAWAGCVSGALPEQDYIGAIEAAGFVDVHVERVYIEPDRSQLEVDLRQAGLEDKIEEVRSGKSAVVKTEDSVYVIPLEGVDAKDRMQRVFSGKVTARKP